jgi:hypothetical protein
MGEKMPQAKRICVTIAPDLALKLEKRGIQRSEALRVGATLMLAEAGDLEYDNRLQLYRKMKKYQAELQALSQKITEAVQ